MLLGAHYKRSRPPPLALFRTVRSRALLSVNPQSQGPRPSRLALFRTLVSVAESSRAQRVSFPDVSFFPSLALFRTASPVHTDALHRRSTLRLYKRLPVQLLLGRRLALSCPLDREPVDFQLCGGWRGFTRRRVGRAVYLGYSKPTIQLCKYYTGQSIVCQAKSGHRVGRGATTSSGKDWVFLSPRAKSRGLAEIARGAVYDARCLDYATLRST
jgi:hypothetical protein